MAPAELVKNFFEDKYVEAVFIKPCNRNDGVQLWKHLSQLGGISVALLRDQLAQLYYRVGIYMDLSCKENLDVLHNISTTDEKFNTTYTWLIELNSPFDLKSNISPIKLRLDSDVTVTWAPWSILYDVHKKLPGGILEVAPSYEWNEVLGIKKNSLSRKNSLEGTTLTGSIFVTEQIYDYNNFSAQLLDRNHEQERDVGNRLYYALNLHLSDLYNYSLELVVTDDWGSIQSDGTFNGMIGEVHSKKVNVSIGPAQLSSERLEVVHPIIPLHTFNFPFVFKQPRRIGSYSALSLQLSPNAWLCVGILSILAALTFYFSEWASYFYLKDSKHDRSLSNCILLVIGALSAQGLTTVPQGIVGRMVCVFILILGLMVATYYNAATMNALLSPSPLSIRNLHDLVNSNLKLIFMDLPYFTNKPVRERLLSKEVLDKMESGGVKPLNLEEGLSRVLKGNGFCGPGSAILGAIQQTFTDEQKCDLTFIDAFPAVKACTYISKNSPLREILFQGNLRLIEHGLADRQRRYWFPSTPECVVNQPFVWVGMESVAIAIGIFVAGGVLAIVILLGEMFFNYYSKKIH